MGRIKTDALRISKRTILIFSLKIFILKYLFFLRNMSYFDLKEYYKTNVLTSSNTSTRLECKLIEISKLLKKILEFYNQVFSFPQCHGHEWVTAWVSEEDESGLDCTPSESARARFMSMEVWAPVDYTLLPSCCSETALIFFFLPCPSLFFHFWTPSCIWLFHLRPLCPGSH